ncbi:hypothetical protein N2152v2_001107 [Parachlorella kessleri]
MSLAKKLTLAAAAVAFMVWFRLYTRAPQLPANSQVIVEEEAEPSDAAGFVKWTLSRHRVVVFSKSYCGFSRLAKQTMERNLPREKFHVVELDQRADGPEIQQVLAGMTGGATVPRCFIDKEFIGGGTDVAALDQSGELAKMLKDKGIL